MLLDGTALGVYHAATILSRVKEEPRATPVYVLVLGKGYAEAVSGLSKEEQDALWAKVETVEKQAGGKWRILCDSRWADEEVYDWGVLEYPSIEAYWQKVAEFENLNWWRYFSAPR